MVNVDKYPQEQAPVGNPITMIANSNKIFNKEHKFITYVARPLVTNLDPIYFEPVTLNGVFCTRINISGGTINSENKSSLMVGDFILILDENNNSHTQAQILSLSNNNFYIIVDYQMKNSFQHTQFIGVIDKKYINSADYKDGKLKIDFAPFLKNKVYTKPFENFVADTYYPWADAAKTNYIYNVILTEEYIEELRFTDNIFLSGNSLGLIIDNVSSLEEIPFKIGDEIIVEQDLYSWEFNDNYSYQPGSALGFTGSTQPSFKTGQAVTIYGQDVDYYNGSAVVTKAGLNYIVTDKNFTTSTPVDNGIAYGIPAPEYNGVATVLDVYYDSTNDIYIVKLDKPHNTDTGQIGGTIRYADGRKTYGEYTNFIGGYGNVAYFGGVKSENNTPDGQYVYDIWVNSKPNICFPKMRDEDYIRKIKPVNNGYTLFNLQRYNTYPVSPKKIIIQMFDKNQNQIGPNLYFDSISDFTTYNATYITTSLFGLLNNYTIDSSLNYYNAMPLYNNKSIAYFSIGIVPNVTLTDNQALLFEVDWCESKYENMEVIWEDAFGSYQSWNFDMASRRYTEVEKKTYNKSFNQWDYNENLNFQISSSVDGGDTTYSSISKESYKITTDWVEEKNVFLFEDLLSSKKVFIKEPGKQTLYLCQIKEDKIEKYKDENNEMVFYTFEIAQSLYRQR